MSVLHKHNFFFIGVGGAGMSAIAQYLSGNGKSVKGSDRMFLSPEHDFIKDQLEAEGILCYQQDGSGINEETEVIVISTAIEDSNIEIVKAKSLQIPVVLRADLLSEICESKRTIAIAGTSGKSTTTAMLFHTMVICGMSPSLITGAGLVSLQQQGKIGNAFCGKSDWLLIEADESDGTLVKYKPEIGVLLSIDKDHKELSELMDIFSIFRKNVKKNLVVNASHELADTFSQHKENDFGEGSGTTGDHFIQEGFAIRFDVTQGSEQVAVHIPTIGKHNMENALAVLSVCKLLALPLNEAAKALATYPGIYRRHQLLYENKGIILMDDYAHNPAKIAASIRACQPIGKRLIAWFQPHGYGPTRFIRKELVDELSHTLREQDEIWMSEIYYAGGTAVKDISSNDIIQDLRSKQVNAFFVANRQDLMHQLIPQLEEGDVLLLMGARDPGLETFAHWVKDQMI